MKKVLLIVFILTLLAGNGCTFIKHEKELVIARKGKTRYCIVIADDASPSTVHGALELQMFLYQMTGASLPVYSDRIPMRSREIILGDNDHLRQLEPDIDLTALGDEGYMIRTEGSYLVIAGGERRGTMYGVYGLLEDHLGFRWFTPTVSRIPHYDRLAIPPLDETTIPVLEYREPYTWEAFDGDWAARNRMNRNSKNGGLRERHGGKIEWVPDMFVHTFEKLVPPSEYFRRHPEYFSLVNGRRQRYHGQLCCTDEDVIRIVTEAVLKAFRENPQADVLSVSQNDWDNHCECKRCQALANREGSQIAPVLQMVNRVAEEVEKEFPGKTIETLAYQWTQKPPKTIRPRHNVVVRLCTIECCFSHPLDSCDSQENREFSSDLRAWSRIADRLWIWNYVTSFSHYFVPYPDFRVRAENMRFFVRNNVKGVFQQDVYTTPAGELSELSAYVNAKLLWNPDYDENTAIDEFLGWVYSGAAPYIRAYIDMLHDKVELDNIHIGIWQGPDAGYLTDEILARADSLWDEAESAVEPDVLDRVKTARLSVDYAIIARDRTRGDALLADQENLRLTVNPTFTNRVDRFCAVAKKAGVLKLSEYDYTIDEYKADIDKEVRPRTLTLVGLVNPGVVLPGLIRRTYRGNWNKMPNFSSLKPRKTEASEWFQLPESKEDESLNVTFTGYIRVPCDGIYTFYTRSADGSKLYIGSTVVVDNGGNHAVYERMGFVALKAGLHPITVIYYSRGKLSELDVLYRCPGAEKQRIPASELWRVSSIPSQGSLFR